MTDTAYAKAASQLREEIFCGQHTPGGRLPGERELCGHLKVSRITLRHALRLLAGEGLIERRHGSGNYVVPHPTRRIPVMIDYTGSMREHAPKLKRELLVSDWRPVGGRQAAALQIEPEGTVLYAERVDTIERQPVAWDQAMIHRDYAGKLTAADLARVDFLEIWMKRGRFQVSKCVQTIEAVAATASVARRLGLRASVPILRSTEIYLGPAGQAAGVFVSYYYPNHLCIRSQFQWNRKEKP